MTPTQALVKLMTMGLTPEQMAIVAQGLEGDQAAKEYNRQKQQRYRNALRNRSVEKIGEKPHNRTGNAIIEIVTETPPRARIDNTLSFFPLDPVRKKKNPPIVPPATFQAFWDAYPHRAGNEDRKAAVQAYSKALKRASAEVILAGTKRYSDFCDSENMTSTSYVRQARTWLNADGWEEAYEKGEIHDQKENKRPPYLVRASGANNRYHR